MLRLFNEQQTGWSISVRFNTSDVAGIREFLREEFQALFPGQAFDYDFVDEFHNRMYEEEKKMSRIVLYIAILAIIIAALGLYGLVAWPLSYLAIRRWLQTFPYRVDPAIWPYLAALSVTLLIAYGSMLYHTFKASRINPADSLRYE
jgi:putative ABC transport system permease protein